MGKEKLNRQGRRAEAKLERSGALRRQFTYRKGNVQLDFTLRVDTKNELEDFLDCLKEAQKEIEQELESK